MKKLVVLILFMFMASVATAAIGLDILVNGSPGTEVEAGDTVTLEFTDTPAANFNGISAIEIDVDWGDFTSFAVTMTGGMVIMDTLASTGAGDGFSLTGSRSVMLAAVPGNGIVFTVIFDIPGDWTADEVVIDLAGSISVQAIAGLSTTLTPEPMTMALLGLGGLFLRRRKK